MAGGCAKRCRERPDKRAEVLRHHLRGRRRMQQERGEQVRSVEEGKQGESVHLCFLSSLSQFAHSLPGPVDVMLHPYAHHLQISMGIKHKNRPLGWL